jgi:EmrB/QacA subfamily drug resistance transporter
MSTAVRTRHSTETRTGLIVALGGLLAVLDTTIVAVAIPDLMGIFGAPLTAVQWLSSAYTLALVATMPLAAWLGGRFGAGRVYVAALFGFAVASAAAGLAADLPMLIIARAALGLAGGLITPLGMAIAFSAAAPERRGRMAALTGLPLFIGPILGPVLGGVLLEHFSWRALFFVTVLPALLAAGGVLRWVRSAPVQHKPRPDLVGAALLVPGAVAVAYGVSADGATAAVRIGTVLTGLLLGVLFVRRSLRHREPLLRVGLLRDATFGRNALGLALYTAPYFGSMLLMPSYVQVVRSDSALTTAMIMIPGAVGLGASVQVAGRVLDRFSPKLVIGSGLSIAVLQGIIMITVLRPDTSYVVLGALAALQGLGTGAVILPTMATATRHLDGADLASGSAMLPLISTLAGGIGTAAVTATFAALITVLIPGLTLESLGAVEPGRRSVAVDGVVDALRITQGASLMMILTALVVRLRDPGRPATKDAS